MGWTGRLSQPNRPTSYSRKQYQTVSSGTASCRPRSGMEEVIPWEFRDRNFRLSLFSDEKLSLKFLSRTMDQIVTFRLLVLWSRLHVFLTGCPLFYVKQAGPSRSAPRPAVLFSAVNFLDGSVHPQRDVWHRP